MISIFRRLHRISTLASSLRAPLTCFFWFLDTTQPFIVFISPLKVSCGRRNHHDVSATFSLCIVDSNNVARLYSSCQLAKFDYSTVVSFFFHVSINFLRSLFLISFFTYFFSFRGIRVITSSEQITNWSQGQGELTFGLGSKTTMPVLNGRHEMCSY